MRKVTVFNNISLDGFFTTPGGDMSVFHSNTDAEWAKFSADNASGGKATLLFGRKTYDQMASFWPSAEAKKLMPEIAEGMNRLEKIVFSRTLKEASGTTRDSSRRTSSAK